MLKHLKLRHKAALFPTVALLAFFATIGTAPYFIGQNEDNLERVRGTYIPTLEASRDLEDQLAQMQRLLQDVAASQNAEGLEEADSARELFDQRITQLASFGLRDAESVSSLRQRFAAYYRVARSTTSALASGQMTDDTVSNLDTMRVQYLAIRDSLQTATVADRREMTAAFDTAIASNRRALYAYSIIAAVMMSMLVLLSVWVGRSTMRQLDHLSNGLTRLSAGDFSQPIVVESGDELGALATQSNKMAAELQNLFRTVSKTSGDVASAAAGMFAAARQQEAITTQQTAAIEEVGRTIEALSSSSELVNRAAKEVREMATQSLDSSRKIADHTRMVSEHSERIGHILQLIQDIANKSDLLALNAALEGTKAGDAGRAFSLVAAEMRRLSEHVMDSVRDIRKLVADTREASHSSVMATDAGIAVAEKTANASTQISRAAEDQRIGTQQVLESADEIVVSVRDVLTSAAEASRSAEGLLQLSQELKAALGFFKFDASGDELSRRQDA